MKIMSLNAIEYGEEKKAPFPIYLNPLSVYDFQADDEGRGTWVYSTGYPDGVLVTEDPRGVERKFNEAGAG